MLQAGSVLVWLLHPAPAPASPSDRTVLCVGDSWTHGIGASDPLTGSYPAQLQGLLRERSSEPWSVVNCGQAGQNSREVLARLPAQLSEFKPRIVCRYKIWFLGHRDDAEALRSMFAGYVVFNDADFLEQMLLAMLDGPASLATARATLRTFARYAAVRQRLERILADVAERNASDAATEVLVRHLARMVAACRATGCRLPHDGGDHGRGAVASARRPTQVTSATLRHNHTGVVRRARQRPEPHRTRSPAAASPRRARTRRPGPPTDR
ncbi:MAG: GDSL-type esterase/lipase family protein [Planctomycetota bacterium]